ncbi:MAG TPA: CDP-alcohol phosphatidyltransferase family protein [Gaiellaceae bacterium]|nr:CDP-alcohol phosphatidyltransferase family protein [Gaiellaceae bacterium]
MRSALARSRKERQGTEVVCEHVFRPLAHGVVSLLAPLRVPPPAVVVAATSAGLAAAFSLARGHLLVAAGLIQLKTLLDNADGQLARLTGRVTAFGRYLDSECDLLVDAALFAGVGRLTGNWVAAVAGFVALTAILSVNFNLERLAAGRPASWDGSVLGRAYGVLYGWQDRGIEWFVERRLRGADDEARRAYHDSRTVAVLANMGMSTQLLVLGACIALGHPLVFVVVALAGLVLVGALFVRREALVNLDREVVLEHR